MRTLKDWLRTKDETARLKDIMDALRKRFSLSHLSNMFNGTVQPNMSIIEACFRSYGDLNSDTDLDALRFFLGDCSEILAMPEAYHQTCIEAIIKCMREI